MEFLSPVTGYNCQIYCISFSEDRFFLANSAHRSDEMLYYVAFHMVLHCKKTFVKVHIEQFLFHKWLRFYFNFNPVTLSENKQLFGNFGLDN